MHKWILICTLAIFASAPAFSKTGKCYERSVKIISKHSPAAYRVWQESDKDFFKKWLNCDTYDNNIPTAVHESVHFLVKRDTKMTGMMDYEMTVDYFLPDFSRLTVTRYDIFYRAEISSRLPKSWRDGFFVTYLSGPTGQQELTVLLDELNAYTFDVIVESDLYHLMPENTSAMIRDSLLRFMFYLELYIRHAREKYPKQYQIIKKDPAYLLLIKTLWENAESALIRSAPHDRIGKYEKYRMSYIYSSEYLSELYKLFEGSKYSINFKKLQLRKIFLYHQKLAKHEIPEYNPQVEKDAAEHDKKIKEHNEKHKKKGAGYVMIGGQKYTYKQIKEKAKDDPVFRVIYDELKKNGLID